MPSICSTHRVSAVAGYTLVELVVSMVGAAVLAIGLASSLAIATQSLSVGDGELADVREGHRVLAQLHRDVQSAVSLSELTATSVTMTVPDRDGDSVPEVIRYAWSSVPGDPLTMAFNGQTPTEAASNVQSFSLSWMTRYMEGVSNLPVVLFVSSQPVSDGDVTPTAEEQLRIDKMSGWGFDVEVISQSQSTSEFDEALGNCNVVFVSGEVALGGFASNLYAATIGVVTESTSLGVAMGLHSAGVVSSESAVTVASTAHYITETHVSGPLVIADSGQPLKRATGSVAPGAKLLASVEAAGTPYPSLIAVEVGKELADASNAAGRRAQLPWGDNGMSFAQLNADGEDLMRRTLEWASGAGSESDSTGIVFEEFTEAFLDPGGAAISVATPFETTEGDLLIAAVAMDGDSASSILAPPGWTLIFQGDNGGRCGIGVWWKLATSSEPTSYDFSWSGSEEAYAWIMRFTGHDPADPVPVATSSVDSSSTPLSPAVTAPADDCLVLRLGAFDDDDVTVGDTGLLGHATITMNVSGSGLGTSSGGAGYVIQPVAGDSGTNNFALTGSEEATLVTVSISPDPSASE